MRKGLGYGRGKGYYNLVPLDRHIHSLSAKGVSSYSKLHKNLYAGAFENKDLVQDMYDINKRKGKITDSGWGWQRVQWDDGEEEEMPSWRLKKISPFQTIDAKGKKILNLKLPTVEILPAKTFDTKFKDDYEDYEQGYATTKIMPDGTTKVFVRDDGDSNYSREGKLLMHELKEIEIFKDLVNNKGVDPAIADEMAHNLNPVKVEGVSDTYELNASN